MHSGKELPPTPFFLSNFTVKRITTNSSCKGAPSGTAKDTVRKGDHKGNQSVFYFMSVNNSKVI